MRQARFGRRVAAGFVLAVLLAACGGGDDAGPAESAEPPEQPSGESQALTKLVAEAKAEGSLDWYSGYTEIPSKRVADAFSAQYGIKVNMLRLAGADLISRLSTELGAGAKSADVVMLTDALFLEDAHAKGWTTALKEADLPALSDFPETAKAESYFTAAIFPWGIAYNTNEVAAADVPETAEDLLDPKFKGKILYADPRTSVTVMANMEFWYRKYGREFVTSFASQVASVYPSATPAIQALIAGQGAIMVQADPGTISGFIEGGAPLKSVVFDDATSFDHRIAITASAAHPKAARLFANWLMTKEGQRALAVGAASPLGDIDGNEIALPPGYEAPDVVKAREDSELLIDLLGLK